MINFSITRILNSTSLDNHNLPTTPSACIEICEHLVVEVRKAVIKSNKMNTQGKYKVIRYRDNGQLEGESNWKDGKKVGLDKWWYENGQLESEVNYKDGELDGLFKTWYEDGELKHESNWKDGKKDGLSKSWYEDGQLESRRYYTDGGFVI